MHLILKNYAPPRWLFAFLGVFLSVPLAVQSVPGVSLVFFAGALGVIAVFLGAAYVTKLVPWQNSRLLSIFAALLILFAYGIAHAPDAATLSVWKDFFRGIAFFAVIYIVTKLPSPLRRDAVRPLVDCFSYSAVGVSAVAALAGVLKYAALLAGRCVSLISIECGKDYPWGTSLVVDYNFFALTLLCGALIALRFWATAKRSCSAFFWSVISAFILYSGALAGSRRFWVAAPVLILTFVFLQRHKVSGFRLAPFSWGALFVGSFLTVVVLCAGLELVDRSAGLDGSHPVFASRASSLTDSSDTHGLVPRTERWIYAISVATPGTYLVGQGFSYRKDFGCRFLSCSGDDYPHSPLLSALLYAGIVGVLITLTCYAMSIWYAIAVIRMPLERSDLGLSLIAAVLFTSISGDTLFSMPAFCSLLIVVGLLAESSVADGRKPATKNWS